ncbi:prepilin-type N-terminal cleavage/methylation domain-containing protein [Chromobacterium violaceum]|uniref:prepilin-type N-terminal cleavage/methylation domain-containing protein n=1 Tax=Chromobacterium violaceum TaxID=536 RepID=UPI00385C606A
MPMKSARGISLLELLVSMTIGLLLLLIVSGLLVSLLGEQSRERRQAQLGAMMDASLSLMAMELRRAGFWNGSGAEEDNPYRELFIERDGSCLLYGYDNPATPSATPSLRYFAFRLEGQRIQRRSSGKADWNCDAPSGWDDLSKPDIGVVDRLSFRSEAGGSAIGIAVSARAAKGSGEERLDIRTSVTLRNQPEVKGP